MTRKIDVRLAHRQKFLLWEEGPGSTVKIRHDKDIAKQARNDVIEFKLVSHEGYQDLFNHGANFSQLSVSLSV